jgi:hypothetical protein
MRTGFSFTLPVTAGRVTAGDGSRCPVDREIHPTVLTAPERSETNRAPRGRVEPVVGVEPTT